MFKYITKPLKPSLSNIHDTRLLSAQAFHFLATPEEIRTQIPELISFRSRCGITKRPLLVWEPFPAACQPENLHSFLEACKLVDVFSPNHLEMTALFLQEIPKTFEPDQLEAYARIFLEVTVDQPGQGCVVVRAAEHGCLVGSRSEALSWLPAFYALNAPEVVDATGAGNAFLGGFSIGLHAKLNIVDATSYGNIAASFALEQIGLPSRKSCGDKETWNGDNVASRLEIYRARLQRESENKGG